MILLSNDTTYPIFTNYLKFDTTSMSLIPQPGFVIRLKIWSGCGGFPVDIRTGAFQPCHLWIQMVCA